MTYSNHSWPEVPLNKILTYLDNRVELDDMTEYVTITVRRRHGGLEAREKLFGHEIKTKKQFRLVPGAFIISRVQCWHQAFAIVPDDLPANMIASTNYDQFRISEDMDRLFFWWLSYSPAFTESVRSSASGVVIEKMVFDRDAWLEKTVPLPPLEVQHRIVTRIQALAVKVEQARGSRLLASEESETLLRSARQRALVGGITTAWRSRNATIETAEEALKEVETREWAKHAKSRPRSPMSLPKPPVVPSTWCVVALGELQEKGAILDIQDGNHGGDYPRKSEFSDEGIPFVTALQMDGTTVDIASAPRLPAERASLLRIGFAQGGDVLLSHNASVGKVALAPENSGDFLIGTSVTYYRCNVRAVLAEYLACFMRSELFQGQLRWTMKQTTRNQVSVLKQVNLWICLPPPEEQRRIVAYLDGLQGKVDALKQLQAQTQAELDALLPSVLDRAFRGEL